MPESIPSNPGMGKRLVLILGLMSGTSLDGMDCALTRITGRPPALAVQLHSFSSFPFTPAQRSRIARACDPETGSVDQINALNFEIGDWLAASALAALTESNVRPETLDLVASHGQTIYHAIRAGGHRPATLQIGDPSVIAHLTGVTTVGNFRTADVAAGGQGAPLVSYVDWLLWRHRREARVILNIGGMANLTYLPAGAKAEDVIAFDTGPGNLLMDFFAQRATDGTQSRDEDGRLAGEGQIDRSWLRVLMNDPYFPAVPPKTTGREYFGPSCGERLWHEAEVRRLSLSDRLATVTALSAQSIAHSIRTHLPGPTDRVYVGGGGGHNKTLIRMLQTALESIPVTVLSGQEGAGDAKEALSFAVLGYETVHGRPGNLPGCTGAHQAVVLGQIAPGRNYGALMRKVHTESRDR